MTFSARAVVSGNRLGTQQVAALAAVTATATALQREPAWLTIPTVKASDPAAAASGPWAPVTVSVDRVLRSLCRTQTVDLRLSVQGPLPFLAHLLPAVAVGWTARALAVPAPDGLWLWWQVVGGVAVPSLGIEYLPVVSTAQVWSCAAPDAQLGRWTVNVSVTPLACLLVPGPAPAPAVIPTGLGFTRQAVAGTNLIHVP